MTSCTCRSCRGKGGAPRRRAATATSPKPVAASASAPSRSEVDELATGLTRQTDGLGQPLDDRGRRFFALRESGYNGPIDQDGYPDTTSEDTATLRRMAENRGETVAW